MKAMRARGKTKITKIVNIALSLSLLAGCSAGKDVTLSKAQSAKSQKVFAGGNELGMIPILEYHRFGKKEERWTRTFANFERDLEFLYRNGYVLLSINDFAQGKIDLPAGKKPVVLTFDDGSPEQFRYKTASGKVERDAKGKPLINPDCAVAILDRFNSKHPDFGRAAAFYTLPAAFEDSNTSAEKLRYLFETGRQLGNHTYHHANLSKDGVSEIHSELSRAQAEVRKALPSYALETLALPYGLFPSSAQGVKAVLQGADYLNRVVLLVGANPSYSPFDIRFDSRKVARIQAIDDEWKRWFNRSAGFVGKSKENFNPFLSDGDPEKISFPQAMRKELAPRFLSRSRSDEEIEKLNKRNEQKAKEALALKSEAATVSSAGATPSALPKAPAKVTVHPGYKLPLPKGGWCENGKIFHKVQSGEVLEAISNRYLKFSDDYVEEDLRAAIKARNGIKKTLSIGQTIEIPHVRALPPAPKTVAVPKTFEARGLYMTATSAGCKRIFRLIGDMKKNGVNTVIFDAKDMSGIVSYDSKVPLARKIGAVSHDLIRDFPKMIEHLHRQGIHVVARQTLFYDRQLATHRSDLSIRSKASGRPWIEQGGVPTWVDPSLDEVQGYNLDLAKELARSGVDEIQFDYIRFPAMGNTRDCRYHFDPKTPKHVVITNFLKRAYSELKPLGVLVSVDVYGVVGWDQGIDVVITGQKIEEMCHFTDVICPMLYSSHFYGNFDNKRYPPDEPYYFVTQGVKKFKKRTQGSGVVIRPWLQAFGYRITHFNNAYVRTQLQAADDSKAIGWSMWDAQNQYKVAAQTLAGWRLAGK